MSAGPSIINSTLCALYVGSTDTGLTKVANSTDASLSISQALRDTTTKDSEGWAENLEGLRSFSLSGSFLFEEAGANNASTLFNTYLYDDARPPIFFKLTTDEAGETVWSGCGRIDSIEFSSPGSEDNVSFTVNITGSGKLENGSVA